MSVTRHGLLAISVCLAVGCTASPWSTGELADPPEGAPLPNGLVVSLGEASFNVGSSLLHEAFLTKWADGMAEVKATSESMLNFARDEDAPAWEKAVVHIGDVSLSASAAGLEFALELNLHPMSLYTAQGPDEMCPVHVAFDDGTWTLPVRLTRSKLGAVQAAAETTGSLVADLVVSYTDACSGHEEDVTAPSFDGEAFREELAAALVTTFGAWLSEAIPVALGLDLATTAPLVTTELEGSDATIDLRASLEDDATWWHWSQDHLVVGFDTRVSVSPDVCVPPGEAEAVAAAPIPLPEAARVWSIHSGTINATLESLWRGGTFCQDRSAEMAWPTEAWLETWPALERLDDGGMLLSRVWPSEAPTATFEAHEETVETTLRTGLWTLELYGRFHEADVRLATLELDARVRASLETSPDRGVWMTVQEVVLESYTATDGLLSAPDEATMTAMVSQWVATLTSSAPLTWLPPTPQPAEVKTSVDGAYLIFSATH